jgi:hypothetical protein
MVNAVSLQTRELIKLEYIIYKTNTHVPFLFTFNITNTYNTYNTSINICLFSFNSEPGVC